MEQLLQAQQIDEGLPEYIQIEQNDFWSRKHKKQKEEDISTCECRYDTNELDSACGERCLNVLTSTECTPGYCPCGMHCKNQRFQKCEYAKLKLFKTEGRGWGLLADENIKAGKFIIEYCGEVISWKEARRRTHSYENQGLKDAFIISLNAHESIDATRKGSLARFINHSCQPNCETRKWTVLGEIRVGIFAKQDIVPGTELGYDYNFEWYGGAKVRCLCGASCCSGFLGAKSRGFQEDTYLWEDDDGRYSVENIPLYDSEEDKPHPKLLKTTDYLKHEFIPKEKHDHLMGMDASLEAEHRSDSNILAIVPHVSVPMEGLVTSEVKTEDNKGMILVPQDTNQTFVQKNAMISRIRSNSACRNYYIQTTPLSNKRSLNYSNGRLKQPVQKEINTKLFGQFLESTEAREEIDGNEERKKQASSELDSLYNEIRPAIEEHEKDSQDSVSTTLAEKWIEASCMKLKTEFDLYSSVIKHVACTPRRSLSDANSAEGDMSQNDEGGEESSLVEDEGQSSTLRDYTNEFTTDLIFKSRDDLITWAKDVGRQNGFVIMIKSSDAGVNGRQPRIRLACERFGEYKPRMKNDSSKEKKLIDTRTKKCGCPFTLRGKKLPIDDDWMVIVECGTHNHPAAKHLEGHSYAGRLTREETEIVVQMCKTNTRPKDILNAIKQRDARNVSTMKTIYNAIHRQKVVGEGRQVSDVISDDKTS